MEKRIPSQLFAVSFSLKTNRPISEDEITTPMLTNGNTSELKMFGSSNAFKKKTKEKKLGIPKTIPQKTLLSCKLLLVLIDLPK